MRRREKGLGRGRRGQTETDKTRCLGMGSEREAEQVGKGLINLWNEGGEPPGALVERYEICSCGAINYEL